MFDGYLIEKEERVISTEKTQPSMKFTWTAGEAVECEEDNKKFLDDLVKSLCVRMEEGVHAACETLYKSLDLSFIFTKLTGKRNDDGRLKLDDKKEFIQLGMHEFKEILTYINTVPHVNGCDDLYMDPDDRGQEIYSKIKNCLESVVWGKRYNTVGRKIFVVSGEDKSIPNGNLENFTVATRASFHLDPEFELKVQGVDEVYRVKINEKRLYYELFCTHDLFDDLGKEA